MPRLYREAPLNAIWEGSGNVIALDVLRAIGRDPTTLAAVLDEIDLAKGAHPVFDAAVAGLKRSLVDPADREARARRVVEDLATAMQASLLIRHGTSEVAEVFIAGRLGDGGMRGCYGALPAGLPLGPVIERARVGAALGLTRVSGRPLRSRPVVVAGNLDQSRAHARR